MLTSCQHLPVVAQCCQIVQHPLLCVAELPAVARCSPVSASVARVSRIHTGLCVAELPAVACCCLVLLESPAPLPCVCELPSVACCSPVLLESPDGLSVFCRVTSSYLLLPSVARVSRCHRLTVILSRVRVYIYVYIAIARRPPSRVSTI